MYWNIGILACRIWSDVWNSRNILGYSDISKDCNVKIPVIQLNTERPGAAVLGQGLL